MSLFVLCLVPGYTIHSITRVHSVRLTVQAINDHFNKGEPTEEQCPLQSQTCTFRGVASACSGCGTWPCGQQFFHLDRVKGEIETDPS
jgi:hypothetical protein